MSYVSDPSPRTNEPPFDPHAYHADIKAHPERYYPLANLVRDCQNLRKIKHAPTLQALKEAFQPVAKAAKADGDIELLGWLTTAAQKRKKELTA